jgi:iron complex outermembrane receptor protein
VLFFQSAVSPGNLRPEQIVSKELGYMLQVPHLGMTLDLKLFDDRLSHLISEKLQLSDFHPTNSNSVRLTGIEVQTTAQLKLGWTSFLNYAYLQNHQATTPLEETAYSRHSGTVGLSRSMGGGMHWSLAYFGASGDGLGQNPYGRTDVTVGRTFTAEGMRYRATATVSRLNSRTTAYLRDLGSSLEGRFGSRLQVRGELEVSF